VRREEEGGVLSLTDEMIEIGASGKKKVGRPRKLGKLQ